MKLDACGVHSDTERFWSFQLSEFHGVSTSLGNAGRKVEDIELCSQESCFGKKTTIHSGQVWSGSHGFFQCPRIAVSAIFGLSPVGTWTGLGLWNCRALKGAKIYLFPWNCPAICSISIRLETTRLCLGHSWRSMSKSMTGCWFQPSENISQLGFYYSQDMEK